MSKLTGFFASNGAVLALSGAAVLVLAGVGMYLKDGPLEEPSSQAAEHTAAQDVSISPSQEKTNVSTLRESAPKFDVARVEPNGQTLIAGTALPWELVEVLLDGNVVVTVQAGSTGEFAAFADLPASQDARVLSLRGTSGGQESLNTIIVAPTQAGNPIVENTQTTREAAAPIQSNTVILADAEGVTILQPAAPSIMSQVALDAISYSESGEVQLSGRASNDSYVRVYLDNRPVTTERIETNGLWRSELPNVDSGIYTLRVDEVDEDGLVKSRVETPFKREVPEKVTSEAGVALVTVQPGATLWAIARDRYGEGQLYLQLYEANKDQIRDPDLIYPGQVFDLPD